MTISPNDISRAAELLKKGELVALPTETVYGLGGNALSDMAVAKIFETKGRPSFNPLIIHVASLEEAMRYATFSDAATAIAKKFWPGPLTLVLPRKRGCAISLLASAGLDTLAIRVPAHPVAQALLQESGLPIAAPSANRSGRLSPTHAEHVREELGNDIFILDGGACEFGIESTVLDMNGDTPAILRPGAIIAERLPSSLGREQGEGKLKSPGQLESHYAPNKPLRLNATEAWAGEVLLAFGAHATAETNLSPTGNLREAAANLFSMLRKLDASAATSIAVMPIPNAGLGVAINDRLTRAAAAHDPHIPRA